MENLLNILILEDNLDDLGLVKRELEKLDGELIIRSTDNKTDFIKLLNEELPNILLSDYKLPDFNGKEAYDILRDLNPDIPFILVSGSIGEKAAIDLLVYGMNDYILKDNLIKLAPAIKREIKEYKNILDTKFIQEELLRLSLAVEQSPNIVILTDLSGAIVYANPQFAKLTGYNLEEALGANPRILKSSEMEDEFYVKLWDTVSNGDVWKGEMSNKKKDGTIYWEKAIVSPVFDKDGKIINYLKIAEDITDKKRMESELEDHREHLEEMVKDRTSQLNEKLKELENLNKLFLNREHRITELRDELKKLKKRFKVD